VPVLRGQRGETLVELLVALVVMGMVLSALAGITYAVGDRFLAWDARVASASTDSSLATALEADLTHFVPCQVDAGDDQLVLCSTLTCRPEITYVVVRSGQGWVVERQHGARSTLLARLSGSPPQLSADRGDAGGSVVGTVRATRLGAGASLLQIPYRSPEGAC
jgi:prepilin-type N-terminal cleavage/methylation domain-containing protein